MGTAYDKFIKKANAEARQNRVNRVVKRTAPYGRGLGKSHKQYIAGDLMSSAKNTAYGYKMNNIKPLDQFTGGQDPYLHKQQQEGKNPYEFKYVYTGIPTWVKGGTSANGNKYKGFWSRNRMATDEEKDLYKKTGNLDFNKAKDDTSYAVMRSHNSDANTFREHLNTPVLDGIDVAKKRVNNGGSKFEYLKGFLKDVVADPVFDVLKTLDYGESALTGGIGGVIEESRNMFDSIADNDIKKVDFSRPIKNAQESIEHSNKTGWGKSMSQFFSEAVDRRDDRELERLKSLPQDAYTKLQIKNIKDKQNNKANKMFETVMGFAGDIGSPIHLGTGAVRVGKKVTGDTINSFNDLRKGTADLSLGIVPKNVREANQKKAMQMARKNMEEFASKKTSNVLDTLHETKPMNDMKLFNDNVLEHSLNKGFNKAMDNDIDKVIKSNPSTQNLGSFLDDIKPQNSPIIDDFENIFEASDVSNSKLGKELFFKKIDNLPDKESDEILDWLSSYNPKVYDEYLNASDDISNVVNDAIQINNINTKADNNLVNNFNKNAQHISQKPKYDYAKIDKMTEENAIEKIARLFDESAPETKLKNNYHRKDKFEKTIRNLSDDIYNGKLDAEDLSKTIQDIKGKDVPTKIKREYINNKLFNGEEVISANVGNKSIDDLIDSIDDVVNLRRVTDTYKTTGEILPVKLSDSTKSFLKLTDDINVKGSKVNGIVNDSPEELLETLNKSIINRSRALTDERYADKLQLMARKFGYDNYSDVTKSIDKLKLELKELDKLPYSKETVTKKLEISGNLKRLNELKKNRDSMWSKIKNLTEDDFDKLVSSKYPEHMKDMKSFSHKSNQFKEIQNLSNEKNVNKAIDDLLKEKPVDRNNFVKNVEDSRSHRNPTYDAETGKKGKQTYEKENPYQSNDFTDNMYKPKDAIEEGYIKAERDEIFKQQRLYEELADLHKELDIPLPKVKNSNVKISSEQKLGKIPDVSHNTSGLKKVIENEMEMMYKNPTKYEKHKDTLKNMKKEFVNALRSYGVKDEQYFKKVKALQDDLDSYYKELNKPSSIVKKSSEGGQGVPKLGMNLQLLADRINKGLNDLDIKNVEKVSKKGDKYVNGFDEFNQRTNKVGFELKSSKPEESLVKELGDEQEMYDIINKIGKKYGGEDVKPPSFDEFKSNFKQGDKMKYEDSKIYDIYKRWLNTWKKGLTVYNPGWHIQNFFQNKGQNYLALGSDAFGSQKNARKLLDYLQGGKNKVNDVVDLKNGKIYSGDDLKALVKRNKVVNSQTNDIIESRGVIPPLETKIDNSWWMKKLGHSEDTARLHHFLKQLERGMSPEDATKSVNKYLFDYDKKSKFDKVIGDFVDPFWVFHKNYAKLLGSSAIENPSAINNILRAERGLETGLAENDRNNTSKQWDFIQSPYNSFKDDKNGKIYDFLYKQKLMPRIQDAIPTNMDEVENKLNPILRLALQQSRNEGNFHNKVVDKDKAGWNEVTKKDRNKEIALELNPFINSFAKAVKNSNKRQKSADEGKQSQSTSDKQAFYDWVQFITGFKGNYYKR